MMMENTKHFTANTSSSSAGELYSLSLLEEMEDNEYLVEVLNILLTEAPVELREMRSGLQNRKLDIVGQKAHKMKNSLGVIQANKLTDYLTIIEMICKDGMINNELIALIENVGQQYGVIEQALKKHIKEIN